MALTGKGGARGVALLPKSGGLAFTAEGLPRSDRYFLWGEDRAGDPVKVGFATYDKKQRRLAGTIQSLPGALASVTTRVFLTLERTREPKRPGRIVLDSGRIGG